MACPYFMPVSKMENGTWPHPSRLPLGAGWGGYCCAPGHEGFQPERRDLEQGCNLGYASGCPRLPRDRACDAVRFSVSCELGSQVVLWFVSEAGHLPVEHGTLEYDLAAGLWKSRHRNPRIQKMAECYLDSYLQKKCPPESADPAATESEL